MQSNQDGPTLTLSDIMHTPSPSPGPQPPMQVDPPPIDSQQTSHHTSSQSFYMPSSASVHATDSPDLETIGSAELHAIRTRLSELALVHPDPTNTEELHSRENEIINLALRLTSHIPVYPDPQQLAFQAQTISGLIKQRDLLFQERDEDHKRWQAERDGWDRMAEALIGKRRAAVRAGIDDETHRQMQKLSDDNKALREKLSETQRRMSTLETELTRLRPLLLMQSVTAPNISFSLPSPTSHRKSRSQKDGEGIPLDKDTETTLFPQGTSHTPMGIIDAHPPEASGSQPPTYYRGVKERDVELLQSSARKSKKVLKPAPPTTSPPTRPSGPILSDARSECLLLAVRKFGRLKAGVAAGIVKEREVDKDLTADVHARRRRERKDKHREKIRAPEPPQLPDPTRTPHHPVAGPSTLPGNFYTHPPPPPPKTPRRGSAPIVPHPLPVHSHPLPTHLHPSMSHSHPHPGSIVYINPASIQTAGNLPVQMQMRTSAGMSVLVPIAPGVWPMPSTPAPPTRRRSSKTPARTTPGPSNPPTGPNEPENDPRNSNAMDRDRETQTPAPATPLDSLLNAARTMMIDEDYDGESVTQSRSIGEDSTTPRLGTNTGRRRRRRAPTADIQGSPVPKRRKTGANLSLAPAAIIGTPERSSTRPGAAQGGNATPLQGRVRSALDVLADQAAQEHERRPSVDPGSQRETPEAPPTEPSINGKAVVGRSQADVVPVTTSRSKGKGKARTVEALHPSQALARSSPVLLSRPIENVVSGEGVVPSYRERKSPGVPPKSLGCPPKERPPDMSQSSSGGLSTDATTASRDPPRVSTTNSSTSNETGPPINGTNEGPNETHQEPTIGSTES